MKTLLGSQLSADQQAEALCRFVHRFTGDNRPGWAREKRPDGSAYPVQFADDKDWLANTRFHVTPAGKLSPKHDFCESSPTWPFNPELRRNA